MNDDLASALLDLSEPAALMDFLSDPSEYVGNLEISEIDKLALLSRNRAILKYQSRFGDLTREQLASTNFSSVEIEQVHIQIGPEVEEGGDALGESVASASTMKSFGPDSRNLSGPQDEASLGSSTKANYLVVVGTGIKASHLTAEAMGWMRDADMILYCVADPATELAILRLNPEAEDLYRFYGDDKKRSITYKEMEGRILEVLETGKNVCAVFYGHPGFLVKPAHVAIQNARMMGYSARMCPAPSCVDTMISDLGIDLSWDGCQIYEASHFLIRRRVPDIQSGLILLQIGCVGDFSFNSKGFDGRHYHFLVERLLENYPSDHRVVLYEASQFTVSSPRVDIVTINDLSSTRINGITTMYVPPVGVPAPDMAMVKLFAAESTSGT